MDKTKAIVASCVFIGLAVMGQNAYNVYHDRAVAEQQRRQAEREQRQRELIAQATADALKLAKGKAAWNAAVKDLPVQLLIWFLEEQVRTKAAAVPAA
jgi:hypothetical protein